MGKSFEGRVVYGLGAVLHKAVAFERNGRHGYMVQVDENSPTSIWMSEDEFHQRYLMLEPDLKLTDLGVSCYTASGSQEVSQQMDRTLMLTLKTRHGWEMLESSSCVDAKDFDADVARNNAIKRIQFQLRQYFGFMLAWAKTAMNIDNLSKEMTHG